VAEAVVRRPALAVREHLVGRGAFLELRLGLVGIRIAVRVIFHRQPPIGALDLVVGGVLGDA